MSLVHRPLWFADCHASPMAGGKPACECQVHSVRQDVWQRAASAGLALPLVQGHGEWVQPPVHSHPPSKRPLPQCQGDFQGMPVTRCDIFQVHTSCKESLQTKCPLGLCKVSVIPPTALNSIDSDGGCLTLSWLTHFLSLPSLGILPSPMPEGVTLVI